MLLPLAPCARPCPPAAAGVRRRVVVAVAAAGSSPAGVGRSGGRGRGPAGRSPAGRGRGRQAQQQRWPQQSRQQQPGRGGRRAPGGSSESDGEGWPAAGFGGSDSSDTGSDSDDDADDEALLSRSTRQRRRQRREEASDLGGLLVIPSSPQPRRQQQGQQRRQPPQQQQRRPGGAAAAGQGRAAGRRARPPAAAPAGRQPGVRPPPQGRPAAAAAADAAAPGARFEPEPELEAAAGSEAEELEQDFLSQVLQDEDEDEPSWEEDGDEDEEGRDGFELQELWAAEEAEEDAASMHEWQQQQAQQQHQAQQQQQQQERRRPHAGQAAARSSSDTAAPGADASASGRPGLRGELPWGMTGELPPIGPGEQSSLDPEGGRGYMGRGVWRFPSGAIDWAKTLPTRDEVFGPGPHTSDEEDFERALVSWQQGLGDALLLLGFDPATGDVVDFLRGAAGVDPELRPRLALPQEQQQQQQQQQQGRQQQPGASAGQRGFGSSRQQQAQAPAAQQRQPQQVPQQAQQHAQKRRGAGRGRAPGGAAGGAPQPPIPQSWLSFWLSSDDAFEADPLEVTPEDCGAGSDVAGGTAGAREDELDAEHLQQLLAELAAAEAAGPGQGQRQGQQQGAQRRRQQQQQPPAGPMPTLARMMFAAAPDLPTLSALLGRLLPPRTKGDRVMQDEVLQAAAAFGRITPEQARPPPPTPPAAPAASGVWPPVSARDLLFAALRWGLLFKRLPPGQADAYYMHPALIALVEAAWRGSRRAAVAARRRAKAAAAAAERPGAAAPPAASVAAGGSFFSDDEAAALLRALVAADAPLPVKFLAELLAQVTAYSWQSGSASSGGGAGLAGLRPSAASSVVAAVGSLCQWQEVWFVQQLAPLVHEAMTQFLDAHASPTYTLDDWSAADLASASLGLSRIIDAPPGRFFSHVATRLTSSASLLPEASSASLASIAAAAGLFAAANEAGVAGGGAAAAAAASAAAASGGAAGVWQPPLELLDAVAREFDVRLTLQLEEGKALLMNHLVEGVGGAANLLTPGQPTSNLTAALLESLHVRQRQLQARLDLVKHALRLQQQQEQQQQDQDRGGGGSSSSASDGGMPAGQARQAAEQLQQAPQRAADADAAAAAAQLATTVDRAELLVEARDLQQQLAAAAQLVDSNKASLAEQRAAEAEEAARDAAGARARPQPRAPAAGRGGGRTAGAGRLQRSRLLGDRRSRRADAAEDGGSGASSPEASPASASASSALSAAGGARGSDVLPDHLYVRAAEAAQVLWALGVGGYQASCFLDSCLCLFGDDWPFLMDPEDCVCLLAGLAALQAWHHERLILLVVDAFKQDAPTRWVPGRLGPHVLLRLTRALSELRHTPGEAITWPWLKAGACVLAFYDADGLAAQGLMFTRLGYGHGTFNILLCEAADVVVPACCPQGLADLALAFSDYRLDPKSLYPCLLDAAAERLGCFDELQLVRLLDGLMLRAGLDLGPLADAAQDLLLAAASISHGGGDGGASPPGQAAPLRTAPASGASLACVRLLQVLPLCSDAARRTRLVELLLPGVSGIASLLPVYELYGLLAGAAHVAAAAAAAGRPWRVADAALLQPLVAALALRAPEMASTALIDSLVALQQLGAIEATTAALPAAAGPGDAAAPAGAAATMRVLLAHLIRAATAAVEQGGLASSGSVVSLSSLAQMAATPGKVLDLLADALEAEAAAGTGAGAAPSSAQQPAGQAQPLPPPPPLLGADGAAAAIGAAVEAAQDALPHLPASGIAELLACLVRLSRLGPSGPALLGPGLPLLLDLALRELGSGRCMGQLRAPGGGAGQPVLARAAADCVALGLAQHDVQARLGLAAWPS